MCWFAVCKFYLGIIRYAKKICASFELHFANWSLCIVPHLLLQDPSGSWVGSKFYQLLCFDTLINFQASSNLCSDYSTCLKLHAKFTSYYVEIKCQLDATDNFYCRSYCLLNMFRAPLCPSSGARDYYTSGCCLSYLVLGFRRYGVELRVVCPVCGLLLYYAHHQELESIIQVVAACRICWFGFQVVGMVWSWGLCVRFAGCCLKLQPHHRTNHDDVF